MFTFSVYEAMPVYMNRKKLGEVNGDGHSMETLEFLDYLAIEYCNI